MIYGFLFIAICIVLIFIQIKRNKNEKTEEEKLQEQIEDELLFDPYSGAKITLEQAESGEWSVDNVSQEEFDDYLDKSDSNEEREEKLAVNYLTKEKKYEAIELSDDLIDLLNNSAILSKNNNWTYSDAYLYSKNSTLVLINVNSSISSQLLMIININSTEGHYYLREKSNMEKIFDTLRNDDELTLDNYESFTIKKTKSIKAINQILVHLVGQRELEIELNNNVLLLKTLKHINVNDLKRLEDISNNVCLHMV